ncbi:MAG: Mut7-C ubiquitin/RNAse domain-containing protein [Bacteroidales bacterium]|nr:Mut7-C ubiquitin/RNAse domain-containing protein [Bacteroidales bacterium]
MKLAHFRFYEELNEFLPEEKRKTSFSYEFGGKPSVKDAIEALGVPHVEVDLILVNGESVDFAYNLKNGDNISVYPVFEGLDITPLIRLREKPLRKVKFILDAHLGRLAKYLRLCGFDTLFSNRFSDPEIVDISEKEKRIILTRDRGILKNNRVTHGYWIRSQIHEEQLKEVLTRFDLKDQIRFFTRCIRCNSPLEDVKKEDIAERLEEKTRLYYSSFKRCPGCNRIYWSGSHFENMKRLITQIING